MYTRNKIKKYLSQNKKIVMNKLDKTKKVCIQEEKCEKKQPTCVICYCRANAWLNCSRGGISFLKIPKHNDSDNPVCIQCCTRIDRSKHDICPLCRSTDWYIFLDIRYPKKKKSFIERKEIKAKKDEEKKLLLLQEALALRQILTQAGYRNHVQSEDEDIDYHLSGYRNRTQSEDEDSDRDYHWNEH